MIEIKIKTGNEAFAGENFGWEVSRILRKLSNECPPWSNGDTIEQSLRDVNDNTVGSVVVTPED